MDWTHTQVMATADPVNTIAESLKETDELPRKQIAEIVEVLGPDACLAILAETRRVQDEGGVAVRDGTRRRTDGGVFFSLAKAQLPKADRNRIFRIRPPKSPESERLAELAAPESSNGSPVQARSAPALERPRTEVVIPATATATPAQVAGGRRRIVEVEVLRSFPKPQAPVEAPARPFGISRPAPTPPERPQQQLRPLRRIVTVAPVRDEPPATPEAARDRARVLLKALVPSDQKRVLLDLCREFGMAKEPPQRSASPREPTEPSSGVDEATRERVLAAVTDALGLGTEDLALVLYGEESPNTKSKARGALDRWRRG
jgi:hypothetical protein